MSEVAVFASYLVYPALALWFYTKVVPSEFEDMRCPDGPDTTNKSLCKEGNGKLWAKYKHLNDDSVKSSLDKISELNKNYGKFIAWRRYLFSAVIASILIFFITQRTLPNGFELLGSSIVIFIVFYMLMNYYRVHHDKYIEDALEGNLKHINKKLNT